MPKHIADKTYSGFSRCWKYTHFRHDSWYLCKMYISPFKPFSRNEEQISFRSSPL